MAASIGTRTLAQFILDHTRSGMVDVPEGWKRLSGGSCRLVFLHVASKVVYKVNASPWDEEYTNASEVRNAKALARLQWEHVYIPKTSLFTIDGEQVCAMEYITGMLGKTAEKHFRMEAREEMLRKGRLGDMHGENFIFDFQNRLVPIDLGSTRHPRSALDDEWDGPDRRVLTCGGDSAW